MTAEIPKPRYQKGEIVRVVDEPYEDCPFEWISEMDDCCGLTATITDVSWNALSEAWGYTIDIDEYGCTWCENCFVEDSEIEESDANVTDLFV